MRSRERICITCVALMFAASSTSAVPPPSPGTQVGSTAWENQANNSSGYRIARRPNADIVHFCWTDFPIIPPDEEDGHRFVRYGAWDLDFNMSIYPEGSIVSCCTDTGRAGYPTIAVDENNRANMAFHQRSDWPGNFYFTPWHLQFPFEGSDVNLPEQLDTPTSPERLWPRVETSVNQSTQATIHHVLGTTKQTADLYYWRYNGAAWETRQTITTNMVSASYVIAPGAGNNVAVLCHELNAGLRNIKLYMSGDAGATWSDQGFTTNYADPFGPEAGWEIAAVWTASQLHVVWDEQKRTSPVQVTIRHQTVGSGASTVAQAYWRNPGRNGAYNANLSGLSLGVGDGSTECATGSNANFLYLVYSQFGGTLPAERADTSVNRYHNAELFIQVSRDLGEHWSAPTNMTNTKTPSCSPGPANIMTGLPTNPDNVCRSEVWPSLAKEIHDLEILFVSDLDAGTASDMEGTWQMNPVHYLHIPGGTFNAAPFCPTSTPNLTYRLDSRDSCLPGYIATVNQQIQATVELDNVGLGALVGVVSKQELSGPPGWLGIASGSGSFALEPDDPVHVVNLTLGPVGASQVCEGRILVTHFMSHLASPVEIPITFWVDPEWGCFFTPMGENVTLEMGSVTVNFSEVGVAGTSIMSISPTGPPAPQGFVVVPQSTPQFYSITTTAAWTPPATVCFNYDENLLTVLEPVLSMYHYDSSGQWLDVTTSQDLENNIICGQVDNLSPFVLAEPACFCECHGDPQCDGAPDIVDVTNTINVAFRGNAPIPDPNSNCPYQTTDVNCSGATEIIDVGRMINVAFRGANKSTEFCDPCP